MARRVKALALKPDSLGLILRTHMRGVGGDSHKLYSHLGCVCAHTRTIDK